MLGRETYGDVYVTMVRIIRMSEMNYFLPKDGIMVIIFLLSFPDKVANKYFLFLFHPRCRECCVILGHLLWIVHDRQQQ